jgi:hypothetical protein
MYNEATSGETERMTYRLESDLSRDVIEYLNGVPQCWAYKSHGGAYQRAGIPDIVGCYKGRFFGVELKVRDKYPSALQRKTLQEIRDVGGLAITAWDLDTVIQMLGVMDDMISEGKV